MNEAARRALDIGAVLQLHRATRQMKAKINAPSGSTYYRRLSQDLFDHQLRVRRTRCNEKNDISASVEDVR